MLIIFGITKVSQYGPVKEVRIALDDGGHARGYAFIEFEEAVRVTCIFIKPISPNRRIAEGCAGRSSCEQP